jgi:hypothetical protein
MKVTVTPEDRRAYIVATVLVILIVGITAWCVKF